MDDHPAPDPGSLLQIERTNTAAEVRIVLIGELDIASATRLREVLDDASTAAAAVVRVDAAALRFIDAAGIGELVRAHAVLQTAGRSLVLENLSATAQRTFRLAEAGWLID
jgi:anti-anti-sigma factor